MGNQYTVFELSANFNSVNKKPHSAYIHTTLFTIRYGRTSGLAGNTHRVHCACAALKQYLNEAVTIEYYWSKMRGLYLYTLVLSATRFRLCTPEFFCFPLQRNATQVNRCTLLWYRRYPAIVWGRRLKHEWLDSGTAYRLSHASANDSPTFHP